MQEPHEFWESVLSDIETAVSRATFITWFKNTHAVRWEDGVLFIGVPSKLAKDWFVNRYQKMVMKFVRSRASEVRAVEYIISEHKPSDKRPQMKPSGKQPTIAMPLEDFHVSREDNLNPRYTFNSFVVGSFNELAHAAALAVINNLGAVYNPLFIYGKTGHGKTHIIQAIGNEVKRLYKNKKVYYVTSERFTQDFINSLQNKTTNDFKERYRKYDVFIMDDIQFLSGKEKTQEELFHLFNTFANSNRQIVFSSDQHPNYIPNLEERLKSRFSAGMTVDIPPPDRESRTAILKTKLLSQNFSIPDETVEYLSQAIDGNIRQLEGTLNTVIMQTQLKQRNLSISEVQRLIKNNIKPRKMISMDEIIKVVAGFYNVEESSIFKKTRKKEIVRPRQIIMYILREDYSFAFPTIGQKLGGRDHTTVIHSYERVRTRMKNDSVLTQEIDQIRAMVQ